MAKRDILKRSHPYYNKKEVLEKAEELERRAKNLYKVRDDFENEGMDSFNKTRAELYDKAGEHYLNAKRPRKAIFCYKKAAEDWELLNSITGATQFELRHGVKLDKNSPALKLQREYGNYRDKDLKNAERLKKTLKGKWHGLEGKSISGVLGIGGILGSVFFFSNELTGNAVSNIPSQTSNIFGGLLFFIGIVGCLNYFRSRR